MVDLIENNEDLGSVREKLNELIGSSASVFTATSDGLVPAPGAPTGRVLLDNATWGTSSSLPPDGDYGSVTVSGSGTVWTVDVDAITLAQLADIPANSILGNISGAPNNPQALTATQVTSMLDLFTSGLRGLTPPSGGGTSNFLRADGTWSAPPGISDGDKGDVIVSGGGAVWTLNTAGTLADYVTLAGDDTITGQKNFEYVVRVYDDLMVFSGYLDHTKVFTFDTTAIPTATTLYYEVPASSGRLALDSAFTSGAKGLVPASGGGTTNFLRADGTWSAPPAASPGGTSGQIQYNSGGSFAGFTMGGDATIVASTGVLTLSTVNSNVGSFGSASQVSTFTVNAKGLITAAGQTSISIPATAISDSTSAGRAMITAASATAQTALLDAFTSGAKGLAPASGGGTTNFLRADGTWTAPPSGGTPGGTSGQLQYNNAGAFGGFTMSGDATIVTSTGVLTLATVNSNVGTFGLAGSVAQFTVNAKGLITAAANVAISIASTAISDATTAGRAMLTAASAAAQTALLDVFTSGAKGLAPASGGGTSNFLRADGTWATPPGGGTGLTQSEVLARQSVGF